MVHLRPQRRYSVRARAASVFASFSSENSPQRRTSTIRCTRATMTRHLSRSARDCASTSGCTGHLYVTTLYLFGPTIHSLWMKLSRIQRRWPWRFV